MGLIGHMSSPTLQKNSRFKSHSSYGRKCKAFLYSVNISKWMHVGGVHGLEGEMLHHVLQQFTETHSSGTPNMSLTGRYSMKDHGPMERWRRDAKSCPVKCRDGFLLLEEMVSGKTSAD